MPSRRIFIAAILLAVASPAALATVDAGATRSFFMGAEEDERLAGNGAVVNGQGQRAGWYWSSRDGVAPPPRWEKSAMHAHSGSHAWRSVMNHPGQYRNEQKPVAGWHKDHGARYFRFAFRAGPEMARPQGWNCLAQWWQRGTSPPVGIWLYDNRLPVLRTKDDHGPATAANPRITSRWTDTEPCEDGVWHHFLVRIKWGADDGELALWKWQDGRWVTKYSVADTCIGYHDEGMEQGRYTWKLGGYREAGQGTWDMFYDDIKYATTWDEAVANPGHAAAARLEMDGGFRVFDTIPAALEASRAQGASGGRTIVLGGGRHFTGETLVLDGRDAGLTITAAEGSAAELSGGRRITGWEAGEDGLWHAPAPTAGNGVAVFRTLLVNGRCADRARYPESGRLQHRSEWRVRWLSTAQGGWERQPGENDLMRMVYQPEDLGPDLDVENAEITLFHLWDETLLGIRRLLPDENTIVFANRPRHPPGAFDVRDYVVWNIAQGITRPGQWYLDRIHGKVVYRPLPGEDMAAADVVAPVLEQVIRVENTRDVTLRGFKISAATTPLIQGDFGAKMFDGAVSVRDSDHCRFDGLEITGVTGWGLKAAGDHLTVANCRIHHTGAGAIRLVGSGARIENNQLHHVGLTYPSAIALYVGVTDPNMKDEWEAGKDKARAVLRHNEIHDAPYIGIGIGGRGHVVEYNRISRVMRELADGSGIYATFCGDMVMRGNVVRDIGAGRKGLIHAYYLDELSDGVLVEDNLSLDVEAVSHNHMARGNIYRNNIFIHSGPLEVTLPRCETHTYQRNLFVSGAAVTFTHPGVLVLSQNLFQASAVLEKKHRGQSGAGTRVDLQTGGNIIAPAGLVIDGDDIGFEPDSPAVGLGIKPVRGSRAGLLERK